MNIKSVTYTITVSFYDGMQAILNTRLYYNFWILLVFKFVVPLLKNVYSRAMQYFDAESALLLLYFLNIIENPALSAF
jgi:hypothetical protein